MLSGTVSQQLLEVGRVSKAHLGRGQEVPRGASGSESHFYMRFRRVEGIQ